MPNQDGSLTESDQITLARALDHMIPGTDPNLAARALDLGADLDKKTLEDKLSRSALLRIIEALSLDMTSHVVGGFPAMTEQQQINALLSIEHLLPGEFTSVLELARNLYYADERTPERQSTAENEAEIFGKFQ